MKFKLPLLLLLSLVWQAAASADEWTNIATAVTVTEGRLCAGELAADGTGTDILCDDNHPAIDSSGNVTVSGELSATILNATQLCDENGANCTDLSGGSSGVSSLASLTDVNITSPVSGSILTYNTSSGEWVNVASTSNTALVAFMACASVNQTPATDSVIFLGSEKLDTAGAFDPTTSRFAAPVDGAYYFHANVLNNGNTGTVNLRIYKNGVNTGFSGYGGGGGTHTYREATVSGILSLNAGDYIELRTANAVTELIASCHTNFSGFLLSGGGGSGGASALTDLTDVSDTTPTEGQLLSYDASENEWVATNVISKTIIYNSIDDDPCVVTAGVRKLSFNPSTGRLRVCRP